MMMDIERLKELKAEFEQVRKYNDRHYMSTATENDVIAIIDEAIARQSVKSEDVQEAIGLLSGKSYGTHNLSCDCVFCKAIDLAITALQAYQPTTRKNRTVEEAAISKTETTGCEWCEKTGKYAGFAYATFFEQTAPDEEYECSVECNYCPNCGRKLN